jgi:hypothetical protein
MLSRPQTSSAYLSALSRATGLELESTFVTKDGIDVAGVSSLVTKTGPLERLIPAPLTAFSALASKSLPRASELHAGTSWIDELIVALGKRYSTVDLMLPPALEDVRSAQWNGWTASPLYTYTLQIDAALVDRWSDGTRRSFKKHASSYHLRSSPDDADNILSLWTEGYLRSEKGAPLSGSPLKSMTESLLEAGLAECWVVSTEENGPPQAGVILLADSTIAVYWLAGSIPGPAMTVLIGQLKDILLKRGVNQLDFVGANTKSIAEFKRRFNPDLQSYFRIRFTRNRILRTAQSILQSLRS